MSTLSAAYRRIECQHFAMREVVQHRDIYPVFRDLFGGSRVEMNTTTIHAVVRRHR